MAIANGIHIGHSIDPADFKAEDIIRKDICIIGGGCSGTYTALRLRDASKSALVVERNGRLGGHASTYADPETGTTLDIGVIVFGHLDEVKNFFARYDIPLKLAPTSLGKPDYVDFRTGETVAFEPPSPEAIGAAFQRYAGELMKHPDLQNGFDIKYPIDEDLLLPFGDYVKKHHLDDLVTTVFAICQGYTPLLELSTVYVMKYFNAVLLNSLGRGFLMTERNNVSELYQKAAEELGSDALLSSSVIAMDRSAKTGPTKVLIQTPSGRKLVLAKKIVSTIPHHIDNLRGYDLSDTEKSLFSQFYYSYYWTCVVRNSGLPTTAPIHACDSGKTHGVPELPGIYALNPNPTSSLLQCYYASEYYLSEDQVKANIIADVQRVQKARGISATSPPDFAVFENHTPFNMMVRKEAIQARFYEHLDALQGQRNTYYNGASFHTQDSSLLWQFTEKLVKRIVADL